jgi:hypothetical protein
MDAPSRVISHMPTCLFFWFFFVSTQRRGLRVRSCSGWGGKGLVSLTVVLARALVCVADITAFANNIRRTNQMGPGPGSSPRVRCCTAIPCALLQPLGPLPEVGPISIGK